MRIHVSHSFVYSYDPPASGVIQVLRLTPRNHEGQYVVRWRIDVNPDARLAAHEDAFGNLTHVFTADGPFDALKVEVDGRVETQNMDGVVRGTVERFPPTLYLRQTPLTQADAAITGFAHSIRAASGGKILAELHGILDRLHEEMNQELPQEQLQGQNQGQSQEQKQKNHDSGSTAAANANAAQVFARKQGSPQDVAHVFIGAARSLGIPARYVAGYFRGTNGDAQTHSGHAWAEAFVEDLGWVGFDPANGFCPTDTHVRVAIGLDSLGASPVRGARHGIGEESATIAVKIGQ
jgi:transglutaminase-like putative cysteine protease